MLDILENISLQGELLEQLEMFVRYPDGKVPVADNIDLIRKTATRCCTAHLGLGGLTGVKRLDFDKNFLTAVLEKMAVDTLDTDDAETRAAKGAWYWLDFKLALFLGLCCDFRPEKSAADAAEEAASAAGPGGAASAAEPDNTSFKTLLADFVASLLAFESLVERAWPAVDQAAAKKLLAEAVDGAFEGTFSLDAVEFGTGRGLAKFRNMPVPEHVGQLERFGLVIDSSATKMRRTIGNLRARSQAEIARAGFSWVNLKVIIVDVAVQLSAMVTAPFIALIYVASRCQTLYARSIGAGLHPVSNLELFFGQDDILDEPGVSRSTYVGTEFLWLVGTLFAIVMLTRLVYSYAEPADSTLRTVTRKLYAVVLSLVGVVIALWLASWRNTANNKQRNREFP